MELEYPARCAAIEPLLMIAPARCRFMIGAACFMPSMTERTSSAMAWSKPSTGMPSMPPVGAGPPALLNSASILPWRSSTWRIRRSQSASCVASAGKKLALAPSRLAIAKRLGANASFFPADATQEADWERLIRHVLDRHGRIDALFNNAGGPAPTGGIEGIPVDGFDQAMALLVRSVMLGMKHAAPIMKRQRAGAIINNGSIAAHLAGYSSSMIYSAAKAAVVHLTRCVAMELGESGVRVNSVSPGAIATGILAKALGMRDAAKADALADKIKVAYAGMQPVPRAGVPDD